MIHLMTQGITSYFSWMWGRSVDLDALSTDPEKLADYFCNVCSYNRTDQNIPTIFADSAQHLVFDLQQIVGVEEIVLLK